MAFIALMPALAFVRRTLALPDERRHLLDAGFLERVRDDGVFINDVPGRFTQGYGVRLEDVEPFFANFGFEQLALLSAESLTIGLESELPALLGDAVLAGLVQKLAIDHAGDPGILGLARHLQYVGRRRPSRQSETHILTSGRQTGLGLYSSTGAARCSMRRATRSGSGPAQLRSAAGCRPMRLRRSPIRSLPRRSQGRFGALHRRLLS
ncbi:MAG: hypothetical protein E6I75_26040 [Chloroflexi bacterium]|nr:MAG: hypothetical protein E6I75_26040 [Chloroflexota bacterium]